MFQWRILQGDLLGPYREFGLAIAHPLYVALGQTAKLIPLGSFPFRVNALSGIGMAITLANVAGALHDATNRWRLSALTAAALGTTHVAWFLSTIAEVYTWSTALFSAELWLLIRLLNASRRRDLLLLALLNGLGLSIHNFALLPLPVYAAAAVWLWRDGRLRGSDLGMAAAAYLAGAAPFLGMIAWAVPQLGGVVPAVMSALVGSWGDAVLGASAARSPVLVNYALGSLSFANVLPFLAAAGLVHWYRRRRLLALCVGSVLLIHFAFVARYFVPDQFTFLLPTMVSMTVLAGIGADAVTSRSLQWRRSIAGLLLASILLPPIGYGSAPAVLDAVGVEVDRARSLPYRQEARYWLVPWKYNERSAERFTQEALAQVGPGDLLLTDNTPYATLRLARHLHDPNSRVRIRTHADVTPPKFEPQFDHRALFTSCRPCRATRRNGFSTRRRLTSRGCCIASQRCPLPGRALPALPDAVR